MTGRLDCARHIAELTTDIQEMLNYARARGIVISDEIVNSVHELCHQSTSADETIVPQTTADAPEFEPRVRHVMGLHGLLMEHIKPATPITIRETRTIVGSMLVANRAIQLLMAVGLFSLGLLVYTVIARSLAPAAATEAGAAATVSANDFYFVLAAASIGSVFYSLSLARRFIVERTFDPQYNQAYIMCYFLGVIAGSILGFFGSELFTDQVVETFSAGSLALVGGYSADAVGDILGRVAEVLRAAVRGPDQGKRQRDQAEAIKLMQEALATAHKSNAPPEVIEALNDALEKLLNKNMS